MRSILRLVPLVVLLLGGLEGLAPGTAHASNDSIVTLGIGTHTMLSRFGPATAAQSTATTGGMGFTLRARVLWVLGAELAYQVTNTPAAETVNVPKPTYQLSALIYLYAGKKASLFLLAGLGATAAGDLFSVSGDTSSYHGGLGLEVAVTPHWTIAADGRINLPGYKQVMTRVDPNAFLERGTSAIYDYYNLDSFQVNLGVRYYL